MKSTIVTTILTAAAIALADAAHAQDNGALLDLLVRKKVISTAEAESIEAEQQKQLASESANKLKLNTSLTELKLGGDLRLRYQYDNKDPQVYSSSGNDEDHSPTGTQNSRWRFRLRLNADFKLGQDFFGGVQLVTGQASDSDNQTYENGFSDYDIYISRAYLGWNAADWLTITAGKVPNPFYSTELVWDADINPTGLTQSIKFHELFASEETVEGGYSKDGKTIAPPVKSSPKWEFALNLGEFIYDDNLESEFDNDASDDAYLFEAQLVGSYKFGKNLKVTVAPGYIFANAADLSSFNNQNLFSDATDVSGESRKLSIVNVPGDVSFKVGNLPAKFYWDFAWNTAGRGRGDDIYSLYYTKTNLDGSVKRESLHSAEDDFAYLVGVQLGENKKAGDWSFYVNWRQTGINAVDPNLNDSDFALSELNTRGVKAALFYNFTDFLNAGVSYSHAWNLRDDLAGGHATGGSAIADANTIDVFQVDVNLKF